MIESTGAPERSERSRAERGTGGDHPLREPTANSGSTSIAPPASLAPAGFAPRRAAAECRARMKQCERESTSHQRPMRPSAIAWRRQCRRMAAQGHAHRSRASAGEERARVACVIRSGRWRGAGKASRSNRSRTMRRREAAARQALTPESADALDRRRTLETGGRPDPGRITGRLPPRPSRHAAAPARGLASRAWHCCSVFAILLHPCLRVPRGTVPCTSDQPANPSSHESRATSSTVHW